MPNDTNESVQIAVIATDIKYIKQEIAEINEKLSQRYVTKTEFLPIQRIVYGMVGLVLVAVFGAVIALVII